MSTIPGYQQRLRAMIFKIHFKEKVDEIKPVRLLFFLYLPVVY